MSRPYSVTQVTPLPVSTLQYSNDFEKENEPVICYETIGGILFDSKYIWTSNGPRFTVINSKSGSKVAAWTFGSVVKDNSTKVVCVDELSRPTGKPPLLVIGLESALTGGMICIFDIIGSRVLRAIQIDEKVTSLHVIDASYDKCPLPGPLRAFDGILSIGTAGGNVLLLDICRHTCDEVSSGSGLSDIRDEINSCSIKTLFFDDIYSVELHKQVAIKNGEHLAIHLNATDNVTPHFILKGPKGEDRVHVNKAEVIVSALHYCPQLGSLLVGYNFGAWQLWNLIDLHLMYTSPIYEENVPVAHFAIQEPCDDPRAFCYVWAVYSNAESHHTGFPVAVLYSLNFDTKEWHEGYGILYQDLTSCAVRFQADLTLLDERVTDNARQGARCLRLQAINKSISKGGSLQEHQEETIALCSIVWSGWSSKSNNVTHTYMSLFDLNQWYKEQMPNSPRLKEYGTYMTHVCLSKLLSTPNSEAAPFLDVRMDLNSLSQFLGSQKLEEHYYPASLAFKLCGLRENDVAFFNNQGSQRALLSHLESSGPSALLKPTELFQQSIDLGLYPLFIDIPNNVTLDDQRELLLSVALEQQLLGWLCRCVSAWSTGSYAAAGCTLHFLLSWGWERALILKQNADKLSTPLFDYSGLRLDANNHSLLSNCGRQLKNLATLFGYIVRRFSHFLLNPDSVKQQWESLQMVSVHLEVLQWLLNVGLLPECPLSSYPRADEFNRVSAPYPVDSLLEYYDERRTHLQSINKEHFSTSGSLLFIDNLIELECGGQKVQKQWEEDDGTGLYPPPSLQALLRTYLTEGVKISFKHCIVVYVFLDLAMTLDQSRYKPIITHLIKFPAVFQLSPSIIKITQAFWQLDHGDFSTAMEQLLDPLVCAEDLKIWHHRVALRALLAQNQHKFALLYLQVRQPAVAEVQDLCTVLSLFIANDMLDEAFHFQRQNRSVKNEAKILQHFYRECDRKGEISSVIHLTLTPTEEEAFMKYLHDARHPKLQDLQIFYYMQRSQYIDAFELNEKLNSVKHSSRGLKGQQNMNFRDLMVKEFTDTLPEVTKSLMTLCREEKSKQWKEVARPEPFSVFVHNTNEQAKYKSSVIHAVLSKAKETWTHPVLNTSSKHDSVIHPITEEMPFLNTPKAVHSESRITTPVIFPKITRLEESGQNEDGPTPPKRFKPSPRLSATSTERQRAVSIKSSNTVVTCNNLSIKLDTPIIKRKISKKSRMSDEKFSVGTPQSILKVYNLVRSSRSPDRTPENVIIRNTTDSTSVVCTADDVSTCKLDSLPRKTSLGLTPRKPLPRTSRHGVRFDISRGSSESSIASEPSFEVIHDEAMVHSSLEGIQKRVSELKPNTSQQSPSEVNSNNSFSADESFYSPDASINSTAESKPTSEVESIVEIDESKVLNQSVMKGLTSTNITTESKTLAESHADSPTLTRSYTKYLEDVAKTSEGADKSDSIRTKAMTTVPSSPKTPRSRRSYKGSLSELSIRSSPRLRKSLLQTEIEKQQFPEKIPVEAIQSQSKEISLLSQSSSTSLTEESSQTPSKGESPLRSKLKGRRPLSRQVLENNTFLKIMDTPIAQEVSTSNLPLSASQSRLEVSYSKTDATFESKKTVESTKESLIVTTEECNEVFTLKKELETFKYSPRFEDSKTICPHVKFDNTKSTLDTNSANVSYNCEPLDVACVIDTISTSIFDVEESSNQVNSNISLPSLEQVTDRYNETIQSKCDDEVEVLVKNDEKVSGIIAEDQQEDFSAENEEEKKALCDSDADTVIIESNLVTEAVNIYEDLSSDNNYGSADPQMNVFEISDDLDLNEGICVGKNVDVLEIDTNYTTSTNDDEVFADKSEVLSNVLAVNENSSGQLESSEVCERNKCIQDLNNVTQTENIEKKQNDDNEIIEVGSSSDENDDDADVHDKRDRNIECSGAETNGSSSLNSSNEEEEYEEVNIEEDMYEEDSNGEPSPASDEQSVSDHSEQGLVDEQDKVLPKEVLSESSSDISDNYSEESCSSSENRGESVSAGEEIKEEKEERRGKVAECSSSDIEEVPNEISLNISEEATNKFVQLDVIPEEPSDVDLESSQVDVSPKAKESVILVAASIPSDIVSNENAVENSQLEIIPEGSETTVTCAQLTVFPEQVSESDAHDNIKLNVTKSEASQFGKAFDDKNNTTENSKAPTSVPNDTVDSQIPSSNENSVSLEQQTVVQVHHTNDQRISEEKEKLAIDNVLNETDILDKTQSVQSTASTTHKDILEESEILEKSPKSRKCLNLTDILDDTVRQSSIYILKSTNDDSDLNESSVTLSTAEVSTDILEKSEFCKSREHSNILNQTDILERTDHSLLKEDNIADVSQLCDEIFKENFAKSSTPARRSRRLSSLQLSTPERPLRLTRRSASFNVPQKTEIEPEPSSLKDGACSSSSEVPPSRQFRHQSDNTIETAPAPRRKRGTTGMDIKEMPLRKRMLRSSSTDVEVQESEKKSSLNTRNRRASSVHVELPVIEEALKLNEKIKEHASTKRSKESDKQRSVSEDKSIKSESGRKEKQPVKHPRKSKSTVTPVSKNKMEEYSTARRLTRRQAVLLEKTLGTAKINVEIQEHTDSDSDDSESHERGPDMSQIDPIKLLDKPNFEGKRDSDEEKSIQQSPSSSVPESPIGSQTTRRLRSRSSLSNTSPQSEVSTNPSLSEAGTSNKRKLGSVKRAIAGVSTRTKQRSKSTDDSSYKNTSSPPKLRKTTRGSKKQDSGSDISNVSKTRSLVESKKPRVIRRTRSASLQISDDAETVESPLRRSERHSLLAKSELPQIIEEQNSGSSNNTVPKAGKRNLRKRSSAK